MHFCSSESFSKKKTKIEINAEIDKKKIINLVVLSLYSCSIVPVIDNIDNF